MGMLEEQIIARGVQDKRVLAAMAKVDRQHFVTEEQRPYAYADGPLDIGYSQTISQPYIVAFMTEALGLQPADKVLEIGTGSGYQTAVLGEIAGEVYTIEIVAPLAKRSGKLLQTLGYKNIHTRTGDGYRGWPEAAPFDKIILTAAPPQVPQQLVEQLKIGGKMVLPVGDQVQELLRLTKTETGVVQEKLLAVRFVPMTGEQNAF